MPDLFEQMPTLSRVSHPLLTGQRVILVGVSAVLYDERGFYFEVTGPRHWGQRPDGGQIVGIGGIGGRIERGEGVLACLRREVHEEIGVGFWLEPTESTALIHQGQVAAWLDVPRSPGQAVPYMVNLLPPQLERSDKPDHLAIVSFRGIVQQSPRRKDLFGLLMIEGPAVEPFFERPEWPLNEALALPGLTFDLESGLPTDSVLRPTLTGRAFQALLQNASASGQPE
ncbi:MAG: NUDIX domain-containing protein [Anaerolineae bacterium]|jgi:ADP-ribose pyrophosphatase YjhB (NUDIX family)